MTLLTPLGLLALISVVILIIIYIIKPNYQQKFISSTFVWKLSLKYKKKRIPTSKLRDILIIICQIAILTSCALVLTQPSKIIKALVDETEAIIIIDASASMQTVNDANVTRYDRAIEKAESYADALVKSGGIVSVIRADASPDILLMRADENSQKEVSDSFAKLFTDNCSYQTADIDKSFELASSILDINPFAAIYFYTDANYLSVPNGVTIVNCSEEDDDLGEKKIEWNSAILNAYTEFDEGYYIVYVDVACYGINRAIDVRLTVNAPNGEGVPSFFSKTVECISEKKRTLVFRKSSSAEGATWPEDDDSHVYIDMGDDAFYSFESINVSLVEQDYLSLDNNFEIWGGIKPELKIQYASTGRTLFFQTILDVFTEYYADRWNITVVDLRPDDEPATSGFDWYIYEEMAPMAMPTDGAVFLLNPDQEPQGAGFSLGKEVDLKKSFYLSTVTVDNPIMKNLIAEGITVSKYRALSLGDREYVSLMSLNDYPVFAVKNYGSAKVAVMSFSLHYSNLAVLPDFPLLMQNMFEYFLPSTLTSNVFEVGEEIQLNGRGEKVVLDDLEHKETFTELPATYSVYLPGVCIVTTHLYDQRSYDEYIYIKVPAVESNTVFIGDTLPDPYQGAEMSDFFEDLVVYLAAALVALVFIEWLLHIREGM